MSKVKICGLTNLTDALAAANFGADYLGFILWEGSKRATFPQLIQQVSHNLPSQKRPTLVAVVVNQTLSELIDLQTNYPIDLFQLHGEEPASWILDQTSPLYRRAYKAIRPASIEESIEQTNIYQNATLTPSLLLDAYHPDLRGGTGALANLNIAKLIRSQAPNLMLAGGLNPENISSIIKKINPYAVDTASGTEKSIGIKEHSRLKQFIQQAKI